MILYRWRGDATNFGDELNMLLWPRLLPGFFDDDPAIRFLGIGSVLDQRHPPGPIKIVAGSGYGGYEPQARLDKNWFIHWVRGPRTAATLGLPTDRALGDPAALVPLAFDLATTAKTDIGFMPHFESAARGRWQHVAERAGVHLIDPRDPPMRILSAIARCRILLSEALHGVIVADALRVPWVPIRPLARMHRAKWLDWAEAMGLRLRFHRLPASSIAEWAQARSASQWPVARHWLKQPPQALDIATAGRMIDRATLGLRGAACAEPQLSCHRMLDRGQSRMLEAMRLMASNPMPRTEPTAAVPALPRLLPAGADSAYQGMPIG